MEEKEEKGEKFSNHPCHRLSIPSAKRFWCRHCFEMFDDPISRWRHSKACKNTGLSNLTRRKEQEATALEAYSQSTGGNKGEGSKQTVLANLNPKQTTKSYVGPKDEDILELSCFICKREFSTMDEMKEHVRVPCNKTGPTVSDEVFPFPTRSNRMFREDGSKEGSSHATSNRTTSPIDTSNLSSETMAAVEALNMMARSDKVNLTQFLNQLSEGGFVIEQAAGSSVPGDTQDREIVFTVQGDVDQTGNLLQPGGDITVEVAENLIRMAQRVRVEAVERISEEQVQEEVVQEDLVQQNEVQYFQDQDHIIVDQAQYVENPQLEEQGAFVPEHVKYVKVEPLQNVHYPPDSTSVIKEELPEVNKAASDNEEDPNFTVLNMETGQHFTGKVILAPEEDENIDTEDRTLTQITVPGDPKSIVIIKNEDSNESTDANIPDSKRKFEEEDEDDQKNSSQVKKLCSEQVPQLESDDSVIEIELSEAKKKLQFFNDAVIVQEKCNKNFISHGKNDLEHSVKQPSVHNEKIGSSESVDGSVLSDTPKHRTFLDEIDGCIKPMTEEMIKLEERIKTEESLIFSCVPVEDEKTNSEETVVVPKRPKIVPLPSPKQLRSSSRKLVLTPKKLRLMEEKEKRNKHKKNKGKNFNPRVQAPEILKILRGDIEHKEEVESKQVTFPATVSTENVSERTDKKSSAEPSKVKSTKPVKCRACDKIFSSIKHLQRHRTIPCVVKITRNMCQKVLRPKRALPRLPDRKVVKKKPAPKENKKPKLLPVGFQIQAQWIPCKVERRPSKGRGRPRKESVHYERQKRIVLPDRTVEVSSLSEKEQFLFELGLVCIEYVDEELRRPVKHVELSSCLQVSVDAVSEKTCDISPPLLEKIEAGPVNQFIHDSPPDLDCALEPPVLEPVYVEHNSPNPAVNENENYEESSSPVLERHFTDGFPCKNLYSSSEKALDSVNLVQEKDASDKTPKKEMLEKLKTALKNVCSPQKVHSESNSKQIDGNVTPECSPRTKRNLFDSLHALCSNSPTSDYSSSENDSASLSQNSQNSAVHLCPVGSASKVSRNVSVKYSPSNKRKMPNILMKASSSASPVKQRARSFLDIAVENVEAHVSMVQNQNVSNRDHVLQHFEPVSHNSNCVTNNVSSCESSPKLSSVIQCSSIEKTTEKTVAADRVCVSSKLNKTQDLLKPVVSLSSKCGQVLVSPLGQTSLQGTETEVNKNYKQKLCDASTQCTGSNSPVKTALGELEHKLRLLKSALLTQNKMTADLSQGKQGLLPEVVSALLKYRAQKSKAGQKSRLDECPDTNLPDIVTSTSRGQVDNRIQDGHSSLSSPHANNPCLSRSDLKQSKTSLLRSEETWSRSEQCVQVSNQERICSKLKLENSSQTNHDNETNDNLGSDLEAINRDDRGHVKVQYIDQGEPYLGSGLTYLLLQQEGVRDYLNTVLGADLDLLSRETIKAVTDDEEIVTTKDNTFNSDILSRTVDRETLVSYAAL